MTAIALVPETTDAPAAPRIDPGSERLGLAIWALLFFNGLIFTEDLPLLVPIPPVVGKLATQLSLGLAAILVLVFNRQRVVRPNMFLALLTALVATSAVSSVRMATGLGMLVRYGRFAIFVGVLWLLSPLWGRCDRILLKWHAICLGTVLASVIAGGLHRAGPGDLNGRLWGWIWPVLPTQVGHYAAMLAGIVLVLVLTGSIRRRVALLVGGISVFLLMLTHTRTAAVGLVVALVCACITLIAVRRIVRIAAITLVIVVVMASTVFAPTISSWFARGGETEELGDFNGRRAVWDRIEKDDRSLLSDTLGMGLTNKSFEGLAIDNSWYSTYQDQGWVGVIICAAIFIGLLMLATTRPRGPSLAVAVFIIVYCIIASPTEVVLGDVTTYLLDLTVAAALLATPLEVGRWRDPELEGSRASS